MKVLIIYDSFFGNTEKIARAMGGSLGSEENVRVCRVAEVQPEQFTGIELLIAGSPTRGFRPTPAITDFFKSIPANGLRGIKVLAFDTRIATSDINSGILRTMVNLGGYAAKRIAGELKKKGGDLILPPEGFYVTGQEGPLKDGELERAAEWAMKAAP